MGNCLSNLKPFGLHLPPFGRHLQPEHQDLDSGEFEKTLLEDEEPDKDKDKQERLSDSEIPKPTKEIHLDESEITLAHTNLELNQRVKDLEERIRKRQIKNDVRFSQLKASRRKQKLKTDDLKQELLDTQQQLVDSRHECEVAIAEKEQLEKRLKETIYRFQSDYSEKAALLNAQISTLKGHKETTAQEVTRLHELLKVLSTEKKTLEEKVLDSMEQMKAMWRGLQVNNQSEHTESGNVVSDREGEHVTDPGESQ